MMRTARDPVLLCHSRLRRIYDIVYVNPEKSNELYTKMRNLNRLLAWGHARVLENLLGRNDCSLAVCDQFGDESYIKNALMGKGKTVTLVQTYILQKVILSPMVAHKFTPMPGVRKRST
jgi:ribonuclease HIII